MATPRYGLVMYVADLERMSRFYSDGLGLVDDGGDGDHRVLRDEAFELVLVATREARSRLVTPVAARTITALKPVFAIDDLEAARARLHQLGGEVDPPERVWTFREHLVCDALDPEGNIVQLRSVA
jgi:catechol 2,3-dioxygenase-like lactoylglutathione lyase family enzyme